MSTVRLQVSDAGTVRHIATGDVLMGAPAGASITTAGAGTLTAAMIVSGLIRRAGAPGAGFTDTTDTATNILTALGANVSNYNGFSNGESFMLYYSNRSGQTATIAGGTGVTVSGSTASTPTATNRIIIITRTGLATLSLEVL